ncbi:MAG: hypothetical protein HY908_22730 [Myxococcales bacterium]|nr:hypothetical protein [Myxococcales bacterium]
MALAGGSTAGCGVLYAAKANVAAGDLEQAKTLKADELAPYEYYSGKAYLEKAMEEAATAEYGDAVDFAGRAGDFADKAIELSRAAHEGSGR